MTKIDIVDKICEKVGYSKSEVPKILRSSSIRSKRPFDVTTKS